MKNSNVKKAFVELVELLEANENKKVSSIMPQILELVTSKAQTKTFITNDKGEVVKVFCYYHKVWEDVSEHEYGAKASSASGLNTMCKVGVSNWTKQQRVAKQAKADLLERVANGEEVDLKLELEAIEAARLEIIE